MAWASHKYSIVSIHFEFVSKKKRTQEKLDIKKDINSAYH